MQKIDRKLKYSFNLSEKYLNEETGHENLPVEMIVNCIKIRFRICNIVLNFVDMLAI